MFRAALVAAAAVPLWAAAAHAQPVAQSLPAESAKVFLKDHEDIPLAWTDGGARLTADYDAWTFQAVEALVDHGTYRIRHEETGQCLTADTSGGGKSAPVSLADCADAVAWNAVFDDTRGHDDYRFITPDGYHLGIQDRDDAVEGAEVLAVKLRANTTKHFQEWRLAVVGAPPPSESPSPGESPTPGESPSLGGAPAPGETPSAGDATSPVAQAKLPTTGAGLGITAAAATLAVAAGAVLVLWWQRRRVLRSHW